MRNRKSESMQETPPRAWGRVGVTGRREARLGKHPHGRGEESNITGRKNHLQETPPRAWGRVFCESSTEKVQGKHPHGRGEETSGTCRCCTIMETPPRAWGRAANAVRIDPASGNTPTGVGKRAHSNFKQFEYYSIFFSFVKEPGSVCADFSIISCSPDMDVKSFVGMPFA